MDVNIDSKLDIEVCIRDDKFVKRSSISGIVVEENVKRIKINNVNLVYENMLIIKGVVLILLFKEESVKYSEKVKGVRQLFR